MILIFLTRQEQNCTKSKRGGTAVPIDGRESERQLAVGANLMKDKDGLMGDGVGGKI